MKIIRRNDDAAPLIRERKPFRNRERDVGESRATKVSSLSGDTYTPFPKYGRDKWGALPAEYMSSVNSASYVVFSYRTPIAWFATRPFNTDDLDMVEFLRTGEYGMWVVPDVTYSLTTSEHQSLVRGALGGWSYVFRDLAERPEPLPYVTGPVTGRIRVPCGTGRRGW